LTTACRDLQARRARLQQHQAWCDQSPGRVASVDGLPRAQGHAGQDLGRREVPGGCDDGGWLDGGPRHQTRQV